MRRSKRTNLDSAAARDVLGLFRDARDRGQTLLLVTHDASVASVVVGADDPDQVRANASRHAAPLPPADLWAELVAEGSGVFLLDDRELPMTAGDLLIAPEGVPHGVRNPGPGRLLVVAVLAPAPAKG